MKNLCIIRFNSNINVLIKFSKFSINIYNMLEYVLVVF